MDENARIRCPQCRKTLAARATKGRVEVKMKRSRLGVEIVIGAIICPRCDYRLNVPLSALEVPLAKPLPPKEAPDARGI